MPTGRGDAKPSEAGPHPRVRAPTGRRYLVTGISSGIGAAIGQALCAAGHAVVGIARRPAPAEVSAAAGPSLVCHALDLSELDALPRRFGEVLAAHDDLDGAVLVAGRGQFGSLEEFSPQQIRSLVDLNLTAQLLMTRALVPQLKRRDCSDLVLVGSEAALSGGRRGAVYCATKFALRGMAEALRQEGSRAGLRVTLINPGMVDTPFFEGLAFEPGAESDEHLRPSDVADAVLLALSAAPGTVYDQISLSPLKKVLRFKPRGER